MRTAKNSANVPGMKYAKSAYLHAALFSLASCSPSGTLGDAPRADSTQGDAGGGDSNPGDTFNGDSFTGDTDVAPLGCGSLTEGQTQTITFYDVPSVATGDTCASHSEERSRTCTGGSLSVFTGSFAYENCYVRSAEGTRPGGSLLADYVLETGLMNVSGVSDNLSGATWNPLTGTYFSAINDARVIEFLPPASATITPVDSWVIQNRLAQDDYEGISWVVDDIFVISDERNDRAVFIRIETGTGAIDLADSIFEIAFPTQDGGNNGLEGISFTPDVGDCGSLFAIQETPYELYRFTLPCVQAGVIDMSSDIDHSLSDRAIFRLPGLGQSMLRNCLWTGSACDTDCTTCDKIDVQDFAGITYVPATGRVIIVSENVGIKRGGAGTTEAIDLLTEFAFDGSSDWIPTAMMELPNHQAEGVTVGENGELLVVSEPDIVLRLRIP